MAQTPKPDTAELTAQLTAVAVDTTHVGYLLAAALQDATPEQRTLLQNGTKPFLKTCARPFAAAFPAYLATVMGTGWTPAPEWAQAIEKLEADPQAALPKLGALAQLTE